MRISLLPSIKASMADDGLSYLDDIESLEIFEIIERRKISVLSDRANDFDCTNNVGYVYSLCHPLTEAERKSSARFIHCPIKTWLTFFFQLSLGSRNPQMENTEGL
ncbi:hypothetical protein AVEN_115732-1 [Araneus ventricosus]|uniref:Uncharacterized protein n=1 Tax=Araneus ventricosus TaxID=182803 RepID=A0A4Y2SWF3_ARAVE|nr:hypothetical protein AVEN_115732-1 [Araneus ventricosus]